MAEEYSWAITQAAIRLRCRRSGYSMLEFWMSNGFPCTCRGIHSVRLYTQFQITQNFKHSEPSGRQVLLKPQSVCTFLSGVRIKTGTRNFPLLQNGHNESRALPAFYPSCKDSFSGSKAAVAWVSHVLLEPRIRISGIKAPWHVEGKLLIP